MLKTFAQKLRESPTMTDCDLGKLVLQSMIDGGLIDIRSIAPNATEQLGALVRSIAFEHVEFAENEVPALTEEEVREIDAALAAYRDANTVADKNAASRTRRPNL